MASSGELIGSASFDLESERQSAAFVKWVGSSGLVNLAVVFTDIIDSTKLNVKYGITNWEPIRFSHFNRAKELLTKHRGYLIKTIGDSVMAVFRNSVDALNFAREFEFDTGYPIVQIRAGIHIGQVKVDEGDVFGPEVAFASRVSGKPENGGIWVSDRVQRDWLKNDPTHILQWAKHDGVELKGFTDQHTLWSLPPTKGEVQIDSSASQTSLTHLKNSTQVASSNLRHYAEKLFGREDELKRLDEAWADAKTHVLTFIAWGGAGKTSLVANWSAQLAQRNYDGARYFDWTFYSQGTRRQENVSSDQFIAKALEFFGDPNPVIGSPWGKGERLAKLISEKRSLLILDGVEPLQYPSTAPDAIKGQLKDPAIAALLRGLAQRNLGLCLITTRETVSDLNPFHDSTAPKLELKRLSNIAGIQFLKALGVRGIDNEYGKLVEDVNGHALTLNLIGRYLELAHDGDIRRRDLVKIHDADKEVQGGHASRVVEAYENWFSSDGVRGQRQLAALRLFGLFDRPAEARCVHSLLKPPAINGLTEHLVSISKHELNIILKRLEKCGLVNGRLDEFGNPHSWDAHPLVREYFAEKLRIQQSKGWHKAHARLYRHLKDITTHWPDTLEGLQPLYQSIAHGCQAGMADEALEKVYKERIHRGAKDYSANKLGALGANLAAIGSFFEKPWSQFISDVSLVNHGWLLNEAATLLHVLGRLNDAPEPMRVANKLAVDDHNWNNASIGFSNLSNISLTLGDINSAINEAKQSVIYADVSSPIYSRLMSRCVLGYTLNQAGRGEEALEHFRAAEQAHSVESPRNPLLYGSSGYFYCDLLLSRPERVSWQSVLSSQFITNNDVTHKICDSVEERANQTYSWTQMSTQNAPLLAIGLEHLTVGHIALYRAVLKSSTSCLTLSSQHIDKALDAIRLSGHQDHISKCLMSRSWLRYAQGNYTDAISDLDEALQIAERGIMRLNIADIYLYRGRFFKDKEKIKKARVIIESCGYWRRKEELVDAEEASKSW